MVDNFGNVSLLGELRCILCRKFNGEKWVGVTVTKLEEELIKSRDNKVVKGLTKTRRERSTRKRLDSKKCYTLD